MSPGRSLKICRVETGTASHDLPVREPPALAGREESGTQPVALHDVHAAAWSPTPADITRS